ANGTMQTAREVAQLAGSLARMRNSHFVAGVRNSGKCGNCHSSFVIGLFTDRRPSCPVCQCPDVSENRTKIAPAIFRKIRDSTSPVHHFTPAPLHAQPLDTSAGGKKKYACQNFQIFQQFLEENERAWK